MSFWKRKKVALAHPGDKNLKLTNFHDFTYKTISNSLVALVAVLDDILAISSFLVFWQHCNVDETDCISAWNTHHKCHIFPNAFQRSLDDKFCNDHWDLLDEEMSKVSNCFLWWSKGDVWVAHQCLQTWRGISNICDYTSQPHRHVFQRNEWFEKICQCQ